MLGAGFTYSLYGFATEGWMVFPILFLAIPFGVAGPALQALVTKNSDPSKQGELQGVLVSFTSLAAILNPLIVTQLFAKYGAHNAKLYVPGAPYFFASMSCFTGFILLLAWKKRALL
jgi:MFS transporter, DHA1 family, tetracycline resistance protein